MTDLRFETFWPRLMKYEGWAKIVNDPDDAGGLTKYGISKRAYPKLDIMNLTESDAKEIYWRDYYLKLNINGITDERLAWQVFDFGVNAGVFRAARTLQEMVGTVPDGRIGVKTLELVNRSNSGEYSLHIQFIGRRVMYYYLITERNPVNVKYLKGWIKRAVEL